MPRVIPNGPTGYTGYTGYTGATPVGEFFLATDLGWPSTTAGCNAIASLELNSLMTVKHFAFDAAGDEYAEWTVVMPSDWDAGTVTAVFYWLHPATDTNFDVVWAAQGTSYGNDDALNGTWENPQTVTDTGGTTSDLYISGATSAITISNAAASELVQFRIYRDGDDESDNLAVDAFLLGVMITYTRS